MSKKAIFVVIGVIWLIIIVGFVGVKEYTLREGEEVLLKTRPVDPRDLFRGDYVILSYEISSVNPTDFGKSVEEFEIGESAYVSLTKADDGARVTDVSAQRPADGLFIKGKVQNVRANSLMLEYGIESYFVPEGEGHAIERELRNTLVRVAVSDLGDAIIKDLIIDGEIVDF